MAKSYRIFVKNFDAFKEQEGKVFTDILHDEETHETFQVKMIVSKSPQEGYDKLVLESPRAYLAQDQWYVNIIEREEEATEAVTIFEGKRLGERKGYMLRSMMAEDKAKLKKEIMTSELKARLERKQKIVEELLKKKEEPKE